MQEDAGAVKGHSPLPTQRPRINARALLGKPARQATLRESNLNMVAAHVFAADEPVSRSAIADASGLTRATVTRIVEILIKARILEELPPQPAGGVGRPVVPLAPARGSLVALGLEVNTASIGACVVDLTGDVLASEVLPGNFIDSDPSLTLAQLNQLGASVLRDAGDTSFEVVGGHLSLPGIISETTGILHLAPLLGWRGIDARQLLGNINPIDSRAMQLGNVTALASAAEATLRHRDGTNQNFLYVAGDNSVGSSLVINGEPFSGMSGWNGNFGHTTIEADGLPCCCGATGCLDTYIGRGNMAVYAGLPPDTSMASFLDQAAAHHNPRISAALARAGNALGIALADYVNSTPVKTIVLADNLAQLLPWIQPQLDEQLRKRVLASPWLMPVLEPPRTSRHAAMVGGALTVLQGVIANLHERLESKRWVSTVS